MTPIVLLSTLLLSPVAAAASDNTQMLPMVVIDAKASASPPLVRFTRGNKTIWVLGTTGPLPKDMIVDWTQVERRVAESQVVLGNEGLVVGDNIGFFRAATLWPSIRRVQFNANSATLHDVLPPELHARWAAMRERYSRDGDDERLRPMYAAFELYRAGAKSAGMTGGPDAGSVVERFAKRAGIDVVDARLRLPIENPKQAVRAFDVPRKDDIACLAETLDTLDRWQVASHARAEAWRSGDVDAFRAVRSDGVMSWCWATLTNDAIARQQGIDDLRTRVEGAWTDKMRQTVASHDEVFATVSMADLLDSTGLVAALEREGFRPDRATPRQ